MHDTSFRDTSPGPKGLLFPVHLCAPPGRQRSSTRISARTGAAKLYTLDTFAFTSLADNRRAPLSAADVDVQAENCATADFVREGFEVRRDCRPAALGFCVCFFVAQLCIEKALDLE